MPILQAQCAFYILAFFSMCFTTNAQVQPIILSDKIYNVPIQSSCVIKLFPAREEIDIAQLNNNFQSGLFLPENSLDKLSKLDFQKYKICYVCILQNDTKLDRNIIIKSKHTPLAVFLKKENSFQALAFTGHGSEKDKNGILSIRSRNAVTLGVTSAKIDTIFYITQIIEAGESKSLLLSDANSYTTNTLSNNQYITLFNGLFLGILSVFLFSTFYFYIRIRERFLLWYMAYLGIFIFYYWRDLELWNEQLDMSHQAIPWIWTKGPVTYFIFLFYLFFIKHILVKDEKSIITKFLKYTVITLPIILFIDILLNVTFPYTGIVFTYAFGVLVGCIQFSLLVPIWKTKTNDRTSIFLIIGSLCIFLGWLTILFFDVSIHQYTVRIFTLIELVFFTLAIIEQFLKIKNEKEKAEIVRIQSLNQERSRISSVLHDELGASVSGISMYSFLASQQLKSSNIKAADLSLQTIQSQSHEIIERLHDIIWLTGSQHESLDALVVKLEDYLIRIATLQKIKTQIEISHVELIKIKLPENISRNIFLICREAIHNSLKYSKADKIDFNVLYLKNTFQVSIADNGIGFDQTQITSGNGIKNMKNRATEINALLEINSKPGVGTECVFTLNIKSL